MDTPKKFPRRSLILAAGTLLVTLSMACAPTSFEFSGPVRFNFLQGPGKEARSPLAFEATASTLLGVDHRHGNVTIEGSEESGIVVEGEVIVRAKTAEIAQRLADDVRIETSVDDDERLWLRTIRPKRENADQVRDIIVNYNVRVPFKSDLWLIREHGDTTVTQIQSSVRAQSRHGNLNFANITGPFDLDQEHGTAELVDLGSDASVRKRHGSLKISGLAGSLQLDQAHGSATLHGISGDLTVRRRHGSLKASDVSSALDVESEHGSVDVTFSEDTRAPADVRSRHGRVKLRVAPAVGLDLISEHGGVHSSIPFDKVSDRNHGKTARKSGAPMITVRVQHGSIHIEE